MMSLSHPAPLRVLFLGPLRDKTGREWAEVPFPADGTQRLFLIALEEQFPALKSAAHFRLARQNDFLEASAALRPGDEVALIPPVSGG